MHSRTFRVSRPDGHSLHARAWGDGDCTCLLIHGYGDGSYVWDEFAPIIASRYYTVAIDLRGHGESDWDPEGRYDIEKYVADVAHTISVLNWRRVCLVGHSLGADIAIRVAARFSERILGLVIVDFAPVLETGGTLKVLSDFTAANQIYATISDYVIWLQDRRPLVQKDILCRQARSALRLQSSGGFKLKSDPALVERFQAERDINSYAGDLWLLLGNMSCPVLVVRGVGSAVLRQSVAENMIKALPNARLILVPTAGHAVMIDNPDSFASLVLPFLMEALARSRHSSEIDAERRTNCRE